MVLGLGAEVLREQNWLRNDYPLQRSFNAVQIASFITNKIRSFRVSGLGFEGQGTSISVWGFEGPINAVWTQSHACNSHFFGFRTPEYRAMRYTFRGERFSICVVGE